MKATNIKGKSNYRLVLSLNQYDVVQKAIKLYYDVKDGKFSSVYSTIYKTIKGREARKLVRDALKDMEVLFDRKLTPNVNFTAGFDRTGENKIITFLNNTNAEVLAKALDLYIRAFMGQLGYLTDALYELETDDFQYLSNILRKIEPFVTDLMPSAYRNISNSETSELAKIAYDIAQVVRHRLAWDFNPDRFSAYHQEPRQVSAGEDLPVMESLVEISEKRLELLKDAAKRLGLSVDYIEPGVLADAILKEVSDLKELLKHPGIKEAEKLKKGR